MKIFRKMTALLFVAATMFTFASCEKNNDDNLSGDGSSSGISETNLIGEWGWQSSHVLKNKKNNHLRQPYWWWQFDEQFQLDAQRL